MTQAKASAKPEKAYLAIVEPPSPAKKPPKFSDKGGSARIAGKAGEKVDFRFNPKEYTIKKSAKWEFKGGNGNKKSALPQFIEPEPLTLDVECFLDASETEDGNVRGDVARLMSCLMPTDGTRNKQKPSPPWVIFGWGSVVVVGIVKSVSAKYTLFRPDGSPIRATCQLQIEEMPTDPMPKQNPTSGALSAMRAHTLIAGESLASVAYDEFGDPAMWRAIASVNKIDDPLRVPPGTRLLVPSLSEAAALR